MIYCIGLSRTGTTSLSDYLKAYGLNVIHYPNMDQMMMGIGDGASDIPVLLKYKELDKMFPGSKFIYTVRDNWVEAVEPYFLRKKGRVNQASTQLEIRKAVYGSVDWNRDLYAKAEKYWDNDIRDYFKNRPNDFLELNIVGGDPTSKLNEFLGLANKPGLETFPKSNSREKTWK
jgi:hypothetical protein